MFFMVAGIILLFTLIDFFFHQLSEKYSVPSYYFRNKVIFGILIGSITYFFVKKQRLLMRSLIFSGVVSVLLQIRYYIEGFPPDFVFLFLAIHFMILLAVSLAAFWASDKFIGK